MSTLKVSDIKNMDKKSLGKKLAGVFDYLGMSEKNQLVRFNAAKSEFEGLTSAPISKSEWAKVKIREDIDNIKEKDSDPAFDAKIIDVTAQGGTYFLNMKEILSAAVMAYVGNAKKYLTDLESSKSVDADWNKNYAILTGKNQKESQLLANKIGYSVGSITPEKESES